MSETKTDFEKCMKLADRKCAELMEHCDACQIFISKTQGKMTDAYSTGGGNYFTRFGHCKHWVTNEEKGE